MQRTLLAVAQEYENCSPTEEKIEGEVLWMKKATDKLSLSPPSKRATRRPFAEASPNHENQHPREVNGVNERIECLNKK